MASRVDTHTCTNTHIHTHIHPVHTRTYSHESDFKKPGTHRTVVSMHWLKSNFPDKILIPTLNIYRGGYYNCANMISTSFTALEKITDELTLCLSR